MVIPEIFRRPIFALGGYVLGWDTCRFSFNVVSLALATGDEF